MRQGQRLSEDKIQRILYFLKTSEMSIREIATYFNVSAGKVNTLNRKFKIRNYNGRRTHWN